MTEKKYKLTPEHEAQLRPWADKWIANAMSTKPMDDEDRANEPSFQDHLRNTFARAAAEANPAGEQ